MFEVIVRDVKTGEIQITNKFEKLSRARRWVSDEELRLGESYFFEIKDQEESKEYNVIEEAIDGLRKFQTYRLEAKDQERNIFVNALIEAELQPWQITSLIESLQKKL